MPKFAYCPTGVQWYKDNDRWQGTDYIPSPGDIIFYDWSNGGQDGVADHVGIVERVENGVIYTVEGNADDACVQREYTLGYYEILGYGMGV